VNPLNIFRKARSASLGNDELKWLAQQKKKYPYFSLLHFVEARQALQQKSSDGETLRTIAALYAQDRRRFAGYVEDRFHVNTSSVATLFKSQVEAPRVQHNKPVDAQTSKAEKGAEKLSAAQTEQKTEARPAITQPAPQPAPKVDSPKIESRQEPKAEPKPEPKPEPSAAREVKNPEPKAKPVSSIKIERVTPDKAPDKAATNPVVATTPAPVPATSVAPIVASAPGTIDQGLQTKLMLRSSMIQSKAAAVKKELAQFKGKPLSASPVPQVQIEAKPEPKSGVKSETIVAATKPAVVVEKPEAALGSTDTQVQAEAPEPKASGSIEVKKLEPASQPKAEKVEVSNTVVVNDVKPITENSVVKTQVVTAENKTELEASVEKIKEAAEEQPRAAGRRTQPNQGLGFNSPEQDASFDSLRRSLLELIHSQIGDGASPPKTDAGSPLINDPGKAIREQETKTQPANEAGKPTQASASTSAPMLSAEPDATQVEMQQLDDLRTRLVKMNVLQGTEEEVKALEQAAQQEVLADKAKSLPTEAAPTTSVAPTPAPAKRERIAGEKLGGTDSLRRFIDLSVIEASAISTATGDRIEPLVGGDMRAFRSSGDPAAAATRPQPKAKKEAPIPAEPPSAMVLQRVEKASEELKLEISEKSKPKPQFEGQSSMQRFVSPSFEGAPVADPVAPKVETQPAETIPQHQPAPVKEKEVATEAIKPLAKQDESSYVGSASFSRFVSPSFEPVPPTLQVDVITDSALSAPLDTSVQGLTSTRTEFKATEREQQAEKARAAVEGENSMKRFVSPSFEAVPPTLQVDITPDKPTPASTLSATEVPKTPPDAEAAKPTKTIEPPPKPVLTGDEITVGQLAVNPFMSEEERQAKKNSMMRFVMPAFDGKSETLHLERKGKAEDATDVKANVDAATEVPAAQPASEPAPVKKSATDTGGGLRRFVGLDDTLAAEQKKHKTEAPAEKTVPEPAQARQEAQPEAKPIQEKQVASVTPEPSAQLSNSTFRKFVGPLLDVAGKVRLSADPKAKELQVPETQVAPVQEEAVAKHPEPKPEHKPELKPEVQSAPLAKEEKKVERPAATQPVTTHIDYQHHDLQVEIVLKPEQLKYFKQDPVKLQQVVAKADTAEKGATEEGTNKLKSLMEQESFLRVEREFSAPKPVVRQPLSATAPVEIDSPLPEQLEELQQTMSTGYPLPVASDQVVLQPNAFDARISNFRENLERLRTRGMPVIPEVSAKAIQQKFLDQVVRAMSSTATVSIEAAHVSGFEVPLAVATAPSQDSNSRVDIALAQISKLESAIASNLEAVRQNPASAAEQPVHPAVQASENEGEAISETLAQIHILQGRPDKAIQVYEQLSLKFPEKSGYFASLIKNLTQ